MTDPEQVKKSQEYLKDKYMKSLADSFNPRDEILEQLSICKELKVSYESLEEMDYLVFDIDFKYANMMLRGIYAKAQKDQEDADESKRVKTPQSRAQERITTVEELIKHNNL